MTNGSTVHIQVKHALIGIYNYILYDCRQAGKELPPLEHLMGETHIYETLLGLKFRVSPEAFFQINTSAAEVLYNSVAELSRPTDNTTVIDICCGTGSIGLCLAKVLLSGSA
jgi:tRNA (uracil-5-)-methyltransferase